MKKVFIVILLILFFINVKNVSAHDSDLGIDGYEGCGFDPCNCTEYNNSGDIGDGIDEKWYDLLWGMKESNAYSESVTYTHMYHLDDDIDTIYYQFQEYGYDQPDTSWSTGIGYENGESVKVAFENSILKWDKVYFYKYNSEGNLVKHKLINLVNYDSLTNKTDIEPNILIYPHYSSTGFYASTIRVESSEVLDENHEFNGVNHSHFGQYIMMVNIRDLNKSSKLRERTGAHELGHVLGLFDIDANENSNNSSEYHHEEVLMGYSAGLHTTRQENITYKDIAGVAITRGFHTNNDHVWLRDANNSTLHSNKYICSICNAVKYSSSLIMGALSYGSCSNNHALTSGNMIAVASYGAKDYYKCKYCRYVAPFGDIVEQNYSYVINDNTHTITNNVTGLQYTISGEHDGLDCSVCGHHKHVYNARHVANNAINHNSYCRCGEYVVKVHAVENQTGLLKAPYVDCGYLLNLGGDIGQIQSILKVSVNGSKMLSTGIIILVDEDVEAYLNGTLVFYNYGDNVSSS